MKTKIGVLVLLIVVAVVAFKMLEKKDAPILSQNVEQNENLVAAVGIEGPGTPLAQQTEPNPAPRELPPGMDAGAFTSLTKEGYQGYLCSAYKNDGKGDEVIGRLRIRNIDKNPKPIGGKYVDRYIYSQYTVGAELSPSPGLGYDPKCPNKFPIKYNFSQSDGLTAALTEALEQRKVNIEFNLTNYTYNRTVYPPSKVLLAVVAPPKVPATKSDKSSATADIELTPIESAPATADTAIVAPGPLAVSCSSTFPPSYVGVSVDWGAVVSRGASPTSPVSYQWDGVDPVTHAFLPNHPDSVVGSTSHINKVYSTSGMKAVRVIAKRGTEAAIAFCSDSILTR